MASRVLGIAGEKTATFTVLEGKSASIGDIYDLTDYDSLTEFRHRLDDILQNFRPDLIACDMHPDLLSRRIAEHYKKEQNIPLLYVRHHHAHIAAVLAEHNIFGRACFGLALDGYGFGENNEAWGGELLYVKGSEYKRIGRLKPLRLIGKDAAAKNTSLLKFAFLYDTLGESEFIKKESNISDILLQSLQKNINCTESSSCGRLFDLACELGGIKGDSPLTRILNFEKTANNPKTDSSGYTVERTPYKNDINFWQADLTPLLLKASFSDTEFANFFHGTLAKALSDMTKAAADSLQSDEKDKITNIALSGGCILNKKLTYSLCKNLESSGFTVLQNKKLSPSDSSVSFGMAYIGNYYLSNTAH